MSTTKKEKAISGVLRAVIVSATLASITVSLSLAPFEAAGLINKPLQA